jgi:hypothetical protein
MTEIQITGTYRGETFKNQRMKLINGPKSGARGWFITVDGRGNPRLPQQIFRLSIDEHQLKRLPEVQTAQVNNGKNRRLSGMDADPELSDDEITARISRRFGTLAKMSHGAARGAVTALIVSGAAGVGKSYTVEEVLEEQSQLGRTRYTVIKGSITPIQLYRTLYEFQDPGSVVVLDDADSILFNEDALNLLKSALDTTGKRKLCWMSEAIGKGDLALPSSFEYKGTMVFITNIDFQGIVDEGKSKLAPHFEALLSRSLYLDLTLRSKRDLMCWIRHVVMENEMLVKRGLTVAQSEEVLLFLRDNIDRLRTVSLREAIKASSLLLTDPQGWQKEAEIVMLKQR